MPAEVIASQLAGAVTIALVLYDFITQKRLNKKDAEFMLAFCEVTCPLLHKLHAAAVEGSILANEDGIGRAADLVRAALENMCQYASKYSHKKGLADRLAGPLLAITRREKLKAAFNQAQLAMLALLAEGSIALGGGLQVMMADLKRDLCNVMTQHHQQQLAALEQYKNANSSTTTAATSHNSTAGSSSSSELKYIAAVTSMMHDIEDRLLQDPNDISTLNQLFEVLTVQLPTPPPQQQLQLKDHSLEQMAVAAAALDVLLHLTPRSEKQVSFLPRNSRQDVCSATGLASLLLCSSDTARVLLASLRCGCDIVSQKAAELLTILFSSVTFFENGLLVRAMDGMTTAVVNPAMKPEAAGGRPVQCAAAAAHNYTTQQHSNQHETVTCMAHQNWAGMLGSIWNSLLQLLHCTAPTTAGAAAEATAALLTAHSSSSSSSSDAHAPLSFCSSSSDVQRVQTLLLLVLCHTSQPGPAGAAAAALCALEKFSVNLALHSPLSSEFTAEAAATAAPRSAVRLQSPLQDTLAGLMCSGDELAASRAAELVAVLSL